MTTTASLGYPRFGVNRELKRGLEQYWSGKISAEDLIEIGKQLRLRHWQIQRDAGIEVIPSNDFSFYDHVLDTACMVGAIPARYSHPEGLSELDRYFAMARGIQRDQLKLPAMEMTKWFDTNYHYIVPEIAENQRYHLASSKVVDEFFEAKEAGITTRPVLLGPVSFLLLSKSLSPQFSPLDSLENLVEVYAEILQRLAAAGAEWVQIDEPCLVLDLDQKTQAAYAKTYQQLSQVAGIRIMLATYFGELEDNLPFAMVLPTAGLHIDLSRAPQQLENALMLLPNGKTLSLGVVNGRNIWRTDLHVTLNILKQASAILNSNQIQIAPSCSLMFCPHDLSLETELDVELKSWLAFARQKLDEIVLLKQALDQGFDAVAEPFALNRQAVESRRNSLRTHNPSVRQRLAAIDKTMFHRKNDYSSRKLAQSQHLHLPLLPTTTIGSFPQTREVRVQRSAKKKGLITEQAYHEFLRAEIERTIRIQEEIGLDVLVHGEFERSDMVEYFGEQLTGIAFTQHGWVQSYGSRGVRPPIIYGDVARPAPMTVDWSTYAQSLTKRPVKGMLTGPVTILAWSFVRDDQEPSETCQQIALTIRDEVRDLEHAGIRVIQIDEPAFREGLPLRQAEQDAYLKWAINCFRLSSSGVEDATQIHTHMCYASFNEIIDAIARMDVDVISIEASRSKMELLDIFKQYHYPGDIGPGIYDIHSPNIPSQAEIENLLLKAAEVVPIEQLWVNPDCGLKTRQWEEVIPALENMVRAAHTLRLTHTRKDSAPTVR